MTEWAYVGGTFDLFHPGHVNLLAEARKVGPVVVALNSDEFAERYKRRPIMSFEERFAVVGSCQYVNRIVPNLGDEESLKTIQWLKRDKGVNVRFVVHGDDWMGEGLMRQMGMTPGGMAALGVEFRYVPYTSGVSSSDIERRIRDRCV